MNSTIALQGRTGRDVPEHPCDGPFPTDLGR